MDTEYWLDKADVWIENQIKEGKFTKEYQNKGDLNGKYTIKRTRKKYINF